MDTVWVARHEHNSSVCETHAEAQRQVDHVNGVLTAARVVYGAPEREEAYVEQLPVCEGLTFTVKKEVHRART